MTSLFQFPVTGKASGLQARVNSACSSTRGGLPAAVVSAGFGVTSAGGVRGNAARHISTDV
jgi:hypothetical protein